MIRVVALLALRCLVLLCSAANWLNLYGLAWFGCGLACWGLMLGGCKPASLSQPPVTSPGHPSASQPPVSKAPAAVSEAAPVAAGWQPEGAWTKHRLLVLVPTGPVLIDLSVALGGKSLEEVQQARQQELVQELLEQLPAAASWEALLELPVIRSGWLGNLRPEDDQRAQLISMYDTQRDDLVNESELPAFLSRGLSRSGTVQWSDQGYPSDYDPSLSPWGKADQDNDFALDQRELSELIPTLQQYDLNGDEALGRAELFRSASQPSMASMNRSSMLQAVTLLTLPLDTLAAELASQVPQHRKLATEILRHYTFLSEIPREQWSNWEAPQWTAIDSNSNQQLDQNEVQQLFSSPPHIELFVSLASDQESYQPTGTQPAEANAPLHVRVSDSRCRWEANSTGGVLRCPDCCVAIELTDHLGTVARDALQQQLSQAVADPQLRSFVEQRLQLGANAFELLDENSDSTLSETEFARAWRWMISREQGHLTGIWSLVSQPWVQLADTNADQGLSLLELQRFSADLPRMDRDGDQRLTPHELPLVAKLLLRRSDTRFPEEVLRAESSGLGTWDDDWFSAMDTNQDGVIAPSEFLGDPTQFSATDQDRNGFLSRGEVYILQEGN